MKKREIKQGEIYFCNLDGDTIEREQKGVRPVVILSLDLLNHNRDNVIIAPITSSTTKKKMINHYCLDGDKYTELNCKNNIVLLECPRDISKRRLERRICALEQDDMDKILDLIIYDFKEFVFNS